MQGLVVKVIGKVGWKTSPDRVSDGWRRASTRLGEINTPWYLDIVRPAAERSCGPERALARKRLSHRLFDAA